MEKVKIYDTTLRDGMQAEGVSFSLEDKLLIAQKLDEIGFDYIEGGYAVSNPKEMQFFKEVAKVKAQTRQSRRFRQYPPQGCDGRRGWLAWRDPRIGCACGGACRQDLGYARNRGAASLAR